jgi:hypothetical protein
MNAFLMPIPRVFWPDKPVGGSTDSTNFGAAIYRVQQLKPDTGPTDMGPLLASSHAYWEGGTAFVLVAGLLTGLFWISLLRWTEVNPAMYKHIVVLCFMAALPIDGFFTALNPLYTFILIFYRIIPLFVLVGLGKLIRICCRRSFPSNGNQLCPSA